MKKMTRMLVVILLMTLIITTILPSQRTEAETGETGNDNYNIEIVVDASGSLKHTDPEKNRFTAIDIFLQTLREKGNNVGAVMFTNVVGEDTGLSEMTSKSIKDELGRKIKEFVPKKGGTNIGDGLQTAVDRLKEQDNGAEKVILLISDGNTELGSAGADEKAMAVERKAVEQCITDNIKVYGVCLNSDGKADLEEFESITDPTSGAFLEVKSSDNLVKALKDFYAQIFKTNYIHTEEVIKDGKASKSIEVPAFGVEELNITIDNASKLTDEKITKPHNIPITPNEFKGISSLIGDYYFIKITDPDPGLWTVEVAGEEGTRISFDFVFNANSTVGIELDGEENEFSPNEEIEFTAGFFKEGKKVTGEKIYDDYSGTLVITPLEDGEEEKPAYYPMEEDDENGFEGTVSLDKEATYNAYAVLTCGEFESLSEPITFSVGNSLPTFVKGEDVAVLKINKLFNRSKKIDLNEYFSDKEDQTLEISVIASSYEEGDIEKLDGNEIKLKKLVDGKITLEAKDSSGATVRGILQVEVKNRLWIVFLIIGLIILIVAAIIGRKKYVDGKTFFEGYLNVFSASGVDDSMSRPASNFSGKYQLANFGLMNHQFDNNMYFRVLPDRSVPGYGSHKLQLVSSRPFYYQSPSGEQAVKTLDMTTGMTYDIRSTSQEDPSGYNDTISISLEEAN